MHPNQQQQLDALQSNGLAAVAALLLAALSAAAYFATSALAAGLPGLGR
jgi:hypothetical protein